MTLVAQFLAVRRDKLLMRLGCWLVCFSLIVGLMLPQQRVYAVEPLTMTAVAGLAAAYLGACGLSVVVSGMDKDALVSSVQRLIQEFLDTQLGGMTIQDWLGSVWDLAVIAGKIFMGRPLTDEFADFAQWVAQKYATQVGENVVFSHHGIKCADGSVLNLSTWHLDGPGTVVLDTLGSEVLFDFSGPSSTVSVSLVHGYSFDAISIPYGSIYGFARWDCYISFYFNGSRLNRYNLYIVPGWHITTFTLLDSGELSLLQYYYGGPFSGDVEVFSTFSLLTAQQTASLLSDVDLSVERKKEALIFAPPALEAEQGIALDVGAAATMDLDLVLQGVLDDVLAGDLTSTMEVAGEVDVPVDPPAGEITDVDGLGLPALGAALTSRFPFSIPWDFFRAVQLLAAPAKAPYFEVDFMAPLADEVGGWKGSTTVVLDFSEYAIVGQVSRWTSTIGFCLMLASATKRLIWTA